MTPEEFMTGESAIQFLGYRLSLQSSIHPGSNVGGVLISINGELPLKFPMHQANRLPLRIHGIAIDLIDSGLQRWMWSAMCELIGKA